MARRRTPILAALSAALIAVPTAPAVASDAPSRHEPDAQQVVLRVDEALDAATVAGRAGATLVAPPGGTGGPFATIDATPDELARLRADGHVEQVLARGTTVGLAMAESVPILGAPSRWAAGHRGAGKVVVVIDTGVAADFGGRLVGQACFAATEVALDEFDGHCGTTGGDRRAFDSTCFDLGICDGDDVFDAAAGRPCAITPASPHRECQHGTAVAAVAAGAGPTPGVAPDAGVYAIRVFDPAGSTADLVDVYGALEHVVALADTGILDLASVNLSVATSELFSGACDESPALAGAIQAFEFVVGQLHDRRIPVVTASGNGGHPSAMAFPACLSQTVSVGATDLDDEMASFSNTGAGLDLLAPGADEATSGSDPLDIPSSPGTSTQWMGTSFAAPHVAGALALVEQEYPSTTIDQRIWLLRAGGAPVSHGSATHRRMGMKAPANVLLAQVLLPGEAPIGGAAVHAMGDFDGDGRADVLAHSPGAPADRISYGRADWSFDVRSHQVAGSYQPLVGSFRGAAGGTDDILWYAPGPAGDSIWAGQADRRLQPSPLTVSGTYDPHVGDFDGDGWDDVLWYAPGPAADSVWYGGDAGFTPVAVSVSGSYRLAVGDFDGDGRDDVVFHSPGAGTDSLWRGLPGRGGFAPTTIDIAGSASPIVLDMDGDGHDDVFLYAPGPAADEVLLGRPDGTFGRVSLQVQGSYVPAVGDLDADGRDDIVWHAPGRAVDPVWFGQPSAGDPLRRTIDVSGSYRPLVGDVDARGGDDIVWLGGSGTSTPVWWSHAAMP